MNLINMINQLTDNVSNEVIENIYDNIDELLVENKFGIVDAALRQIDIDNISVDVLRVILSMTKDFSNKLPHRSYLSAIVNDDSII